MELSVFNNLERYDVYVLNHYLVRDTLVQQNKR